MLPLQGSALIQFEFGFVPVIFAAWLPLKSSLTFVGDLTCLSTWFDPVPDLGNSVPTLAIWWILGKFG